MKNYTDVSVMNATRERIKETFDGFEHIYISFSGGKDSTVMAHMVLEEARLRHRKVGLFIIDLEAQYTETITHIRNMIKEYRHNIKLHWFCGELMLRNAVTNFDPQWTCWDEENEEVWVRCKPPEASDLSQYDFYVPKMEFE